MAKDKVNLKQLITMGINRDSGRVSRKYLEVIAEETKNTANQVTAIAISLGAIVYDEDPTDFTPYRHQKK